MATQQVFILIVDDDRGRREFPLTEQLYSISREPKSDIRLFSLFVSLIHATLVRHQHYDGSFYYQLIDGNLKGRTSANSLLINGQKLQFHCLEHEDQIEFGSGVYAKYFIRNSTAIDPMVTDDEYILMGLILIDSAPSSQLEIISVTELDAAATNALKSYL